MPPLKRLACILAILTTVSAKGMTSKSGNQNKTSPEPKGMMGMTSKGMTTMNQNQNTTSHSKGKGKKKQKT